MLELIEANWPIFAVAAVIGIIVLFLVITATRKTKVDTTRTDVLDDGAPAASRNQALIDSPPAAMKDSVPPPTPAGLAGAGTAVAASTAPAPAPAKAATLNDAGAARHEDEAPMPATAAPAAAKETPDPAPSTSDDLTRIKGIGPKLAKTLSELGVSSFAQIAGWSETDIDRIDAQLGRFEGRIRRDDWPQQAQFLAEDDVAGFEAKFGKT